MPQLVKKRRSVWAVLAAGALVASLLAVGTGPAAAIEIDDSNVPKQNRKTNFSACVGDALADNGFTDVAMDSTHYDAISCIAYYGITVGKTADTYAPGDDVSRSQMVLFMERAASLTGADAEDVLDEFDADGEGPVTRAEMAVMLVKLLASADSDVVQLDPDDDLAVTYGPTEFSLSTGRDGRLDYFADSRGEVPRRVDNLISAAYELAISNGTGDGTQFEPEKAVTRAQMASFITRTLAHTTVRPAGLSGQSVGPVVRVSLRDADFNPIVNEWIDAFSVDAGREDDAFSDSGSCSRLPNPHPEGSTRCRVERSDMLTQPDGDVVFAIPTGDVGDGLTLWAWTGDVGDRFGDDTEPVVELDVTLGDLIPNRALVSSDLAPGASKARFGATIRHSVQLQYHDNQIGAVDVGPGNEDFEYSLALELMSETNVLISKDNDTITFDPDGYAEFDVTTSDPRPHRLDNDRPRTVRYELVPEDVAGTSRVLPIGSLNVFGVFVSDNLDHDDDSDTDTIGTSGAVTFDDDRGSLSTVAFIDAASASASGPLFDYADSDGVTVFVTAAALNEYGETLSGIALKVGADRDTSGSDTSSTGACAARDDVPAPEDPDDEVDERDSVLTGNEYKTNRFGTARIPHTGGKSPSTESLVAVNPGPDGKYGNDSDCPITAGTTSDSEWFARPAVEADDTVAPAVDAVTGIEDIPEMEDDPLTTTDDETDPGDGNTVVGDRGDVAAHYPGASQEFLDDFTYDSRGVVNGHKADVAGATDDDGEVIGDGLITPAEFNGLYDTHALVDHDDDGATDPVLRPRADDADATAPTADDDGDYDEDNFVMSRSPDIQAGLMLNVHYVGADSSAGKSTRAAQTILTGDTDDDTIVVSGPVAVFYDDNDEFKVDGEPKSMSKFVKALSGVLGSPCKSGTLRWSSYNYRDSDDIAEWELDVTDVPLPGCT